MNEMPEIENKECTRSSSVAGSSTTPIGSTLAPIKRYIKPEDKVLEYLERARKVLDNQYTPSGRITLETSIEIEVAKMIQLEERREDK